MCCGYKACRSKVWQLQKFWQVDPLEKVGWIMGSDLAQRYNPNNVEWLVYRKRLLLIDSDKFGFTGTIVELHSAYFWICRHVRKPWANDSIGRSQIDVGSQLYDKGFYNAFQVKRPWLDERAAFPQSRWDENRMDSWDLIQLAVGGTFSDIVWNVAWFVCGKRVMSNATRSHSISILSQGQLSQASRKSRCIHVNLGFSQAGSWWRATHRLWQAICFVIYEGQLALGHRHFCISTGYTPIPTKTTRKLSEQMSRHRLMVYAPSAWKADKNCAKVWLHFIARKWGTSPPLKNGQLRKVKRGPSFHAVFCLRAFHANFVAVFWFPTKPCGCFWGTWVRLGTGARLWRGWIQARNSSLGGRWHTVCREAYNCCALVTQTTSNSSRCEQKECA